MDLKEYAAADAIELAARVRAGDVTPEDLAILAKKAAVSVDAGVGAIVEWWDQPEVFDKAGTLAGVPMLIKDLGDLVAGRRCEAGSRLLEGHVPTRDTELMRLFRRAGLMAVGRTKTSELGLAATVETAWRGRTRNPWDPSRIAGGSSGGSAAAVAAGVVPVAHGSDAGGSIRIPASCCGVVGLKPSRGRISAEPTGVELGALNTQFVLTRTIRDAATVLDAVHGVAPWEMAMAPRPPGRTWAAAVGERPRLAVGVTTGHFWGRTTDPEVAAATERTGRELARLGHRVRAVPAPRLGEDYRRATLDVWCARVAHELDAAATATARRIGPTLLEGPTLAWYDHGRQLAAADMVGALQVLHDTSRSLHRYFEQRAIDVLCSPTIPSRPPPLGSWDPRATREAVWYYEGSVIGDLESTTSAFNCSGQPAISLPLHLSAGGLPIGIHFAARFGHEELLLSLAGELEQAMPWADRHPLAWAGAPR